MHLPYWHVGLLFRHLHYLSILNLNFWTEKIDFDFDWKAIFTQLNYCVCNLNLNKYFGYRHCLSFLDFDQYQLTLQNLSWACRGNFNWYQFILQSQLVLRHRDLGHPQDPPLTHHTELDPSDLLYERSWKSRDSFDSSFFSSS